MGTKPGMKGRTDVPTDVVRKRCPQCKKVRAYRFGANMWPESRMMWGRLTPDGPKVCHICIARANGESLPMVHGGPGKKGLQY